MDSIGDLSRALVLRTNQIRLRTEMDQLAVEVATGFVKDPAEHLGGDVSGLLAIDRTLARLDTFRINSAEAKLLSGSMQSTLDQMQSRSEILSQTLISAELSPSPELLQSMALDAKDTLGQTLSDLNKTVAGRFMFSGTATDRAAVTDLETMMTELRTAVTGLTEVNDIDAALDTFFGVGGVYENTIYEGSANGLAPLQLSETETASLDIRADDDAFRELLKSLSMAALASETSLGYDTQTNVELLSTAGSGVLAAQSSIVELRAGLGALEARVEESGTRIATEITATSIARLDLVGTDQYETAARYENIRGQLEALYAITARSQQLSLAEYIA